jgi:hypothetical protein
MFSGEFASHPRLQEMVSIANKSLELVRHSFAASSNLGPDESAHAAFCAWSLLHGILTLDRNGVLQENAEEQERLAIRGVLAIAVGIGGPASQVSPGKRGSAAPTSPALA